MVNHGSETGASISGCFKKFEMNGMFTEALYVSACCKRLISPAVIPQFEGITGYQMQTVQYSWTILMTY